MWDYKGKRVVITGCFSGMGAATVERLLALGAEVHGLDVRRPDAPLASYRQMDLRDPASIDAAAAAIEGPVHALFNCAGLAQRFPPLDIVKVNFFGLRRFTNAVVPKMPAGSAIASISSTAGFMWTYKTDVINEVLAIEDFDAGVTWCQRNEAVLADGYGLSKELSTVWTMRMGTVLIKKGIRINCIAPGPTETPMMETFLDVAGEKLIKAFTQPIDRRAQPVEQAGPLIFLNSDAASYVNGHVLNVDGGFVGGVTSGALDFNQLLADASG